MRWARLPITVPHNRLVIRCKHRIVPASDAHQLGGSACECKPMTFNRALFGGWAATYRMMATVIARGIVATHPTKIFLRTAMLILFFIPRIFWAIPTPTTAPTKQCDVLTGRPRALHTSTATAAPIYDVRRGAESIVDEEEEKEANQVLCCAVLGGVALGGVALGGVVWCWWRRSVVRWRREGKGGRKGGA